MHRPWEPRIPRGDPEISEACCSFAYIYYKFQQENDTWKSKISWQIFYVFDKMTARLPRHTRPYNPLYSSDIPPMFFHLIPRGEHHEESRGAKEEPRHEFFFQLSDGPPDF